MNDAFRDFVLTNLKSCCEEIIEWQDTGYLDYKGYIRQAAELLPEDLDVSHLSFVENFVKNAALHYVKNHRTP